MKRTCILLATLFCCISFASAQLARTQADTQNVPKFYFPAGTTHDFGAIMPGVTATYAFQYINKGSTLIRLRRVSNSCGCFDSDGPREPVLPGRKGQIVVTLDGEWTAARAGNRFEKSVYVFAESASQEHPYEQLFIKGDIVSNVPLKPGLRFADTVHDFGSIPEGPNAVYAFQVTNSGGAPLIIENVMSHCGCLVPEWPKEPLMPGKTAYVKATYHTYGRPGPFTKELSVFTNATPPGKYVMLIIKGAVVPAAQAGANNRN